MKFERLAAVELTKPFSSRDAVTRSAPRGPPACLQRSQLTGPPMGLTGPRGVLAALWGVGGPMGCGRPRGVLAALLALSGALPQGRFMGHCCAGRWRGQAAERGLRGSSAVTVS